MNKIISNERVMKAIYDSVVDENASKHLIETKELKAMYIQFIEKYTDENDINKQNEFWEDLNDVMFGFERRSFYVGFKAAMSLVTGADTLVEGGNI